MYSTEKKFNTIAMVIFSAVTILLIAMRTVIANKFIETVSGFYLGGKAMVLAFNVILVLFTAAIIVLPLIRLRKKRLNVRPGGRVMGIMSLILAAGFVYDVYSSMSIFSTSKASHHFISLLSSARTETTNIAVDIFQGYALLISAIFALISLIYFVILASSCFSESEGYSKRGILALAPVWWCVFKAVYLMLIPMNFSRISDLLYEIVMIAFLLLFFIAFARVASRIDGERCVGKVIVYGAGAAVFGAISSVPRLLAKLMGAHGVVYTSPQDVTEVIYKSDYCFMALAVFIFCTGFVFYALNRISKGNAYLESTQEKIELIELEFEEKERSQTKGEE